MAVARQLRRTNPITFVLSAALAIGFLFFLFSSPPNLAISSEERQNDAAQNPLSPPTKAFFKQQPLREDGEQEAPPVVHYHLNNVSTSSTPVENHERVLILTPLARFYQGYWDNLVRFTYPHEYISLGFIIPKNKEGNAATAALQEAISVTQSGPVDQRFASITILRQDFDPPVTSQDEAERHKMSNQKLRRESMSRARNSLVFTTLGPSTSWVLWLDGDIIETPPTLIQDLASYEKPLIVPNCYQRYMDTETGKMEIRPYDYNSWMDSGQAQALAAGMDRDEILLEGYAELPTYRMLMAHLADKSDGRDTTKLMQLDGVGGTALLVNADVHRDGAMFPAFPFYHLVETEGFAKMAKRLGWSSWGLPNYFVCSTPPQSLSFICNWKLLTYAYTGIPCERVT